MVTLQQAIQNYVTTLTTEGKSPTYTGWLNRRLRDFNTFLEKERHKTIFLQDLSVDEARAFIKWLMDKPIKYTNHINRIPLPENLAASTVHGYARAIRSFGTFLMEEGYTEENVFLALKPPKLPKKIIEPLSEDEIRRILTVIPRDTIEGLRNYAIFLLLLDTGIRLSEMLTLKLEAIDFGEGVFKVMGKGAKEREVPLGSTAQRALIRYIELARPQPLNPNNPFVFLNMEGTQGTQQMVAQMLKRVAKRAHLKHLYPHLLRHTFAVRYLMNGGDAFSLQKILGHESLDMTRRYVELANTDIKKKHLVFSPVDNLNLAETGRGRPRRQVQGKLGRLANI